MGNFQSNHGHATTITCKGFFNRPGDGLGKDQHVLKIFIGHIKKFIYFSLWDDQHMPFAQRKYIQKGEELIIFCNLVAGNLSRNNFTKYGHG